MMSLCAENRTKDGKRGGLPMMVRLGEVIHGLWLLWWSDVVGVEAGTEPRRGVSVIHVPIT